LIFTCRFFLISSRRFFIYRVPSALVSLPAGCRPSLSPPSAWFRFGFWLVSGSPFGRGWVGSGGCPVYLVQFAGALFFCTSFTGLALAEAIYWSCLVFV
jgi:hypothetical protein